MWTWYDTPYLGAGHGVCGIVYMMLKAVQVCGGPNQFDEKIMLAIKNTVMQIKSLQFEKSGNIPCVLGETEDKLIHFCHGATGAVPFFIEAYNVFNENGFLDSAILCGEAVWNRGLLLKGNGICHGITGNIYPFLSLYR